MTNNNLNSNKGDNITMTNNNETVLNNNKIKLSGDDKLMTNKLQELNRIYEYLKELEAMYDLDNIDEDKHDTIYNIFYDKYISLMDSISINIADDKKLTKLDDKYVVLDLVTVNLDKLEFDLDEYRSINDRYEINCIGIIRNKSTRYVIKPYISNVEGYILHGIKSFRRNCNNDLVANLFYNDNCVIKFDNDVIKYVLKAYEEQTAYNEYRSFKDSKEGDELYV